MAPPAAATMVVDDERSSDHSLRRPSFCEITKRDAAAPTGDMGVRGTIWASATSARVSPSPMLHFPPCRWSHAEHREASKATHYRPSLAQLARALQRLWMRCSFIPLSSAMRERRPPLSRICWRPFSVRADSGEGGGGGGGRSAHARRQK